MATTKKKTAPQAAPSKKPGAAELAAFGAAIQNLSAAGKALAKVVKGNATLRNSSQVRAAVARMLNTARATAKSIPITTTPPPTPN